MGLARQQDGCRGAGREAQLKSGHAVSAEPEKIRLIINADDFGWSEGANEAILSLWDEGCVTSCSLMVGGRAAEAAIREARARPGLPVGLHLTLVHGYPLLPPARIPLLVDREGRLSCRYTRAGMLYAVSPAHRGQWLREMEAQLDAFAASGLGWSHLDTHVHFGLAPPVFRDVLARAVKRGIPAVRIPEDDLELYARIDPADARRRRGMAAWFSACARPQRAAARKAGLITTDRCFGFFRSERLDEAYLVRLIEVLPPGCFELHCHPRRDTEAGRTEEAALRSAAFREALRRRGVELTSYAGLAADLKMGPPPGGV